MIDVSQTLISEPRKRRYLIFYSKLSHLIIRCKFPFADRITRSIDVKDPSIDTEVSHPPIMSPDRSY